MDATGGRDTNSALSQAAAWKTIAKVNASSFTPGDQILLKRGEVWRETLTVPSSGAAGKPITFGAYGSGVQPILNGSHLVSSWTANSIRTIGNSFPNMYYASYTTTPNIVFFNNTLGTSKGSIEALGTNGDWHYDPTGKKLYIYYTDDPGKLNSPGIEAGSWHTPVFINTHDYITLQDLSITKSNHSGVLLKIVNNITLNRVSSTYNYIRGVDNDGGATDFSSHITIQNGTFSHNGTAGIEFHGGGGDAGQLHDLAIQNNTVANNGWQATYTIFTSGIKIWGGYGGTTPSCNATIENNDVYSNLARLRIWEQVLESGWMSGERGRLFAITKSMTMMLLGS